MRYIILGSKGFIGSNIFNILKINNFDVIGLSRSDFDITDETCYNKIDFSNTTIVDCIASIDDNTNNFDVNVKGLSSFINYLSKLKLKFNYIYFSTTSTQIKEQVKSSTYIESKLLAEKYIKENVPSYKIIRLIFPFGRGESSNRLFSKLIQKMKDNEKILISDVSLNLTPIKLLEKEFINLLNNEQKEINFTDGKVYKLLDIVHVLFSLLKINKNYELNNEKVKLEIKSTSKIKYDDIDKSMFEYCIEK